MLGLGLSITKALSTLGAIITTNLKMWLGFETSETLGREIVINGDFATDSDWSEGTGWDIDEANNKATHTGAGGIIKQTFSNLIVGRHYVASVTLNSVGDTTLSNTSFQIRNNADNGSVAQLLSQNGGILADEINYLTLNFTATQVNNIIRVYSADNIFVTDFSVKELTQITPDKSGNNNVGELFTGKALDFNGSTDYVEVPNSTSLNVGTDDFTYCFWVYIGSVKAQRIIDKRNVKGFTFYVDQFNVLILELNDGTGYTFFTLGTLTPSVWQRVVISADRDGNAICYINGVAQTPVDISSKSGDLTNTTSLFIGADAPTPSSTSLFFDGFITDIQWYNTILSQSDVTYDYANPNKLAIDNPSTSLNVTNLKAYWALSEGDGLVAYDSGTNLEEEEVVDGNFPTGTTAWDLLNGATISDNKANIIGDGSLFTSIKQTGVFENGKIYQVVVDVTITSGLGLKFQDGANNENIGFATTTGVYTFNFTGTSNADLVVGRRTSGTAFNSNVNSISVREVTASDHGGLINGATYVDAQPRIPQLGMQNWSKGSNLVENSNEGSYGNSPASEILTTNPFGGNTAVRPVPDSVSDRYQETLLAANISTSDTYTYSWFSKQISTPVENYTGNLEIRNLVNCTVVSGSQEQIATNIGGFDRFKVSFTIDDGSSDAIFRLYFGNVIGIGNSSVAYWGHQLNEGSSADSFVLTDGAATLNSTVIANPTIPTQDIFGNAVRDRLNSFNLGKFGGARPNAFTLSGNQATIQLWFKNVNSNDNIYLADLKSATDRIILGFNNSQLSVYHKITNYWFNFGTITDGDWNFATFTFDGTTMKCFIGTTQLGGTKTINTGINIGTTTDFGVGMNHSFPTRTQDYNGHISDFFIYDRVLTSDEIENNYNAGLSAHTN